MHGPLNPTSLTQMRALIDLIEKENNPTADMMIYIQDDYVSVQMKAHRLPINDVRLILGATPLEADEIQEKENRRLSLERNADHDR